MTAIGPANSSPAALLDPQGRAVADPNTYIIGRPRGYAGSRLIWALPLNAPGAVVKRYLPDKPVAEVSYFGVDFSNVIPYGVGIQSGVVGQYVNTVPPGTTNDFTLGPVEIFGRALYCQIAGGVQGTDYRLVWTAYDTAGGIWPRTTLVLCAETS